MGGVATAKLDPGVQCCYQIIPLVFVAGTGYRTTQGSSEKVKRVYNSMVCCRLLMEELKKIARSFGAGAPGGGLEIPPAATAITCHVTSGYLIRKFWC